MVVSGALDFFLPDTLENGQCFRWRREPAGAADAAYTGIAFGRYLAVEQTGSTVVFRDTTRDAFEGIWRGYFDLDRDYGAIKRLLGSDATMARAIAFAPGIRVLRQEPWEALCTFIISQNNHIPRIRGIVERLCAQHGTPVRGGHAFPRPEALAGLSPEALAPVRAGFRAKYLVDAAERVATGALPLEAIGALPTEVAARALMAVHGVGPKVAACALLYGLGHAGCVPVDVWVKRAMAALYPQGFPEAFAPVAGIAQQYLFHYVRSHPEVVA